MAERNYSRGVLPGEYMKTSLVKVYSELPDGDITLHGIEDRPEFYIVAVRNFEDRWTIETYKGELNKDGVLPHEVVERIDSLKQRIKKEKRSDAGKAAAEKRRAGQEHEEATIMHIGAASD